MRKRAKFAALLVIAFIALALTLWKLNRPILYIKSGPILLPPCISGQVAVGKATIRNAGFAPLYVKRLRPSCNCLNHHISRRTLGFLESAELDVQIVCADAPRESKVYLYLDSNDRRNPVLPLTFVLPRLGRVASSPAHLNVGRLRHHECTSHSVTLTFENYNNKDIEVRPDSPNVAVEATEADVYMVKICNNFPVGSISSALTVKGKKTAASLLTIPIRGYSLGEWDVWPTKLLFNLPKDTATVEKVKLVYVGSEKFKEPMIACDNQRLSVALVDKNQHTQECVLEVRVKDPDSQTPGLMKTEYGRISLNGEENVAVMIMANE
jgi:hypothetical protein